MDKLDEIVKENIQKSLNHYAELRSEGLSEAEAYVKSYGEGMRDFWNNYIENHDEIMSHLKKYVN